jgi:hypothetical protein
VAGQRSEQCLRGHRASPCPAERGGLKSTFTRPPRRRKGKPGRRIGGLKSWAWSWPPTCRLGAKEAANRIAKEKKLSRDEKLAVLTEENVKLQIKHLKSLALIRNMHAKGSLPRIHGWLYRVETGTIDVLIDGRDEGPAKRSAKKKPAAKRRK